MSGIISPTEPPVRPSISRYGKHISARVKPPPALDLRPPAPESNQLPNQTLAVHDVMVGDASTASAPVTPPQPTAAPLYTGRSLWQRLFAGAAAIGFVAMVVQLGFSSLYSGRFMPGVSVADISLSGLTRPQAYQLLEKRLEQYAVQLNVGSKSYTFTPSEIGASYDLNATLDQAYLVGHSNAVAPLGLVSARHDGALEYAYKVNHSVEKKLIERIVADTGQAPTDATIVITNGVPTVQAEKSGQAVAAADIASALGNQLASVARERVTLRPSIQPARIKSADAQPAVTQTNALLATPVTITYQGKTFTPTKAAMGEWITYDKSAPDQAGGLIPKINPDGVKHYLQTLALAINVNPVNRKVNVENGNSSEVQAGKDGVQLDQDTLASQIGKAVLAKQPLSEEAPTKPVPFQTEYNRTVSLDYGKYIEINLRLQHLWVYQDHKLIFESPITSGATGAGYPTVQGLFSVQAKQTDRNLNGYAIGYNYNVFVHYWMPFFGNYGLHDASWRSSFGGQDYYYGGSHGCVNLPDATAAFIFNWADVGTPVWVHS